MSAPSLSTFHQRLKTFLFQASFPDIIIDPAKLFPFLQQWLYYLDLSKIYDWLTDWLYKFKKSKWTTYIVQKYDSI